MATYTSYLNLKKPEGGERYALADFNANWDKIDAAVGPYNFGTVSSLSALESALDTFGNSLGVRQSRSVWVQFSANSSPFASTGYAGTFYKVFDNRYRVVFYMNANNFVIEGSKTANGWIWDSYAHDSQLTNGSVNCAQYCSSSETDVTTRLFYYGKTRILSFMGTGRTHAEDEVIMTLPSEHRPVGQVLVFAVGSIKGTPVVMRFNGGNGQVVLFLINGATASGRLYFQMSWVVA